MINRLFKVNLLVRINKSKRNDKASDSGFEEKSKQKSHFFESKVKNEKWSSYFRDFVFPYGFYGPEEYGKWLKDAGFSIKRLELISKDMALHGESGLFAWIASTWHPYIQRVPQELKEDFINELVTLFVKNYPPDDKGYVHVQMKRLEIEAYREK